MARIISISEKVLPNTLLIKLRALDKIRAEKVIAKYKKSLTTNKAQ